MHISCPQRWDFQVFFLHPLHALTHSTNSYSSWRHHPQKTDGDVVHANLMSEIRKRMHGECPVIPKYYSFIPHSHLLVVATSCSHSCSGADWLAGQTSDYMGEVAKVFLPTLGEMKRDSNNQPSGYWMTCSASWATAAPVTLILCQLKNYTCLFGCFNSFLHAEKDANK